MQSCGCEDRSRGARRFAGHGLAQHLLVRPRLPFRAGQPFAERAILADQQVEVRALLRGELEENLFAFRILEALAVTLEELVRSPLAFDADEQRLLVVDAAAQL